MSTTNNNFTVKSLVAKYRNYVDKHCDKVRECSEWQDENGEWCYQEWDIPTSYSGKPDQQLIVTLYNTIAGKKAEKQVQDALSKYADSYFADALNSREFSFLKEHFAEVVSLCLSGIEMNNMDFCKSSQETIGIIQNSPKPEDGKTVFIAQSGRCDIASLFPGCIIKGFTSYSEHNHDKENWALGQIRLFSLGIISHIKPFFEESLKEEYLSDVDHVVWGTAYLSRYKGIDIVYRKLRPNGKMFLFSEKNAAVGISNETHDFRKIIVKEKTISHILSYEENDGFFARMKKIIFIRIDKKGSEKVHIENSLTDISKTIPSNSLDAEILWPSYYCTERPKVGIALSEIVSFHDLGKKWENGIDTDLIIERENGVWNLSDKAKQMPVVAPVDMATEYKDANLCETQLKLAGNPMYDEWIGWLRKIEQTSILLFGKKEKYVVGYIKQLPENGIATLDSVVCLLPKTGIDVRYIAAILLSPQVKNQIVSICEGEINDLTFPLIMNKVIVPNHNDKERITFLSEANYEAIISTKKEMKLSYDRIIENLNKTHMDKLCNYQHSMRKPIMEIGSAIRRMERYISNNTLPNEQKDYLLQRINSIRTQKEKLSEDVEHLNDENTFQEPIIFDINDCLQSFVYYLGNKITINYHNEIAEKNIYHYQQSSEFMSLKDKEKADKLALKKKEFSHAYVDIAEYNFRKIVKNILDNARDHGFSTDQERTDYIVQINLSWDDSINMYRIDFRNNGTPLPDGVTKYSYAEYKKYAGCTGNSGIGGYEIAANIEHYNGDYDVFQDDEWVVVRIFIPKSKAYDKGL